MDLDNVKHLVVGAGLTGSVIAERIANVLDEKVLVIDKRNHIAGNCYSEKHNETGIEFHKYGTHIFHTNKIDIWNYIHNFTTFNNYRHQVLATYKDKVYQMPINLETINSFYNTNMKPYEIDTFLKPKINKIINPKNLEEKAISQVGEALYKAFIKGYTEKFWGKKASELPASIINRLPFKNNYDESYYFDTWQGIPTEGYTELFKNILTNKNIDIYLNTDYFDIKENVPKDCKIIYTGHIDRFFNYKYGNLEYRTLEFEDEVIPHNDYQGTAVMNFSEKKIPFTRIHEPWHLHPEKEHKLNKTLIIREYPKNDTGDSPFYPIRTEKNIALYNKYFEETKTKANTFFAGRLGEYQYYDMDKVIESALEIFKNNY